MMDSARILVVDDEPKQLTAVKRILRRSHLEADLACNGRIGLRMAVKHAPDLVLLDVAMPTMSGYEFLRRFRRLETKGLIGDGPASADQPMDEIPVIFLTALARPFQRVDGLNAGAIDYVTKPFDPDELRARIRVQLRRRRTRTQMLAENDSLLRELESSVSRLADTAQACCVPVSHADTSLGRADGGADAEARTRIIESVRQDVQRVMQTLSRVSEDP